MVSSPASSAADLRRWVEDRRETEDRERRHVREGLTTLDSIGAALDLVALAGRLHGWPIPVDPVRQREDDLARERWSRLREALSAP